MVHPPQDGVFVHTKGSGCAPYPCLLHQHFVGGYHRLLVCVKAEERGAPGLGKFRLAGLTD
jgi:hypothetical protein